jgi:hypothetical protein
MAKYFPTYQTSLETFQQWRVAQQRLSRPSEPDVLRLLPSLGWIAPGSSTPELALFHRIQGKAVPALKQAVEQKQVVRVRSMRGTYFMVERSFAALAVAAAQPVLARRWRSVWTAAGIDDAKKAQLTEKVLDILGTKEVPLAKLREAVPAPMREPLQAAIAKKVGPYEDTLAWLLAELEEQGLVHVDADSAARFEARFPHMPPPAKLEHREALLKVVDRYFMWGNVATPEDLGWWLGMTTRQAEVLMFSGDLPLSNIVMTGGNTRGLMMHSALVEGLRTFKTTREGPVYFLPSRDPMVAHNPFFWRRVTEEKHLATLFQSDSALRPPIVENGKIVGTWRWSEAGVQWTPATRMTPALRKKIEAVAERLTAWIRENNLELSPRYGA